MDSLWVAFLRKSLPTELLFSITSCHVIILLKEAAREEIEDITDNNLLKQTHLHHPWVSKLEAFIRFNKETDHVLLLLILIFFLLE